eukprot:COSAG01_NODE_21486_length_900_cov_1.062422_1_plen_292_part_10
MAPRAEQSSTVCSALCAVRGAKHARTKNPIVPTMKFTTPLLATTLLAAPLLAAGQGKGTECASHADFTVMKVLMDNPTMTPTASNALIKTMSQPCLACIGAHHSAGTCFPAATKGKCTPGDVALGSTKRVTATDSDIPKGLTAVCMGCLFNGIDIPMDKCKGVGGTAASAQCGKKDAQGNALPDDAACVKCKQAAYDTGFATCAPPPPPAPGPGWKEGECTGPPFYGASYGGTTADAASCLASCRQNIGEVGCCRTEAGRAGKTAPFKCFGHKTAAFKPSSAGADKDWSYVM